MDEEESEGGCVAGSAGAGTDTVEAGSIVAISVSGSDGAAAEDEEEEEGCALLPVSGNDESAERAAAASDSSPSVAVPLSTEPATTVASFEAVAETAAEESEGSGEGSVLASLLGTGGSDEAESLINESLDREIANQSQEKANSKRSRIV